MSDITFGMVQMAMGRGADMESPEDRAEFWRMWVTLERELEAERKRQEPEFYEEGGNLYLSPAKKAVVQKEANVNMAGILAAVMAASQAPRPKDEDDGA